MSNLEGQKIKEYWDSRALQQGRKTVGFGGKPLKEQDGNYRQRYEFILPHLSLDLFTMDYGCGIGRYSDIFDSEKYLGVDGCEKLLSIAKEDNPNHAYILCENGTLNNELVEYIISPAKIEQFFTATVLQHNSTKQVEEIFKSWMPHMADQCKFVLYENCHDAEDKEHISFRAPEQYLNIFEKATGFKAELEQLDVFSHQIHGETHALLTFWKI